MDDNRRDQLASLPSTVRELLSIVFRHKKLMIRTFVASVVGALLVVWLFGISYQSEFEVLVKHDRVEPAVTPDPNPRPTQGDSNATTLAINTEQELLQSQDLLGKVVDTCPVLIYGSPHFWTPPLRAIKDRIPGYWEGRRGRAIQKLAKALTVTPITSSSIIQIDYAASTPVVAHCVTDSLAKGYLDKHMEVNRPQTKLVTFFSQQTEQYRKRLEQDELRLLAFARRNNIATAALQRDLAVQQAATFLANLRSSEGKIALTKERIRQLEDKRSQTQARLNTRETLADNGALLANLKTDLTRLEVQRTDLLTKYLPSYRLVQDVEKQIIQTRTAIAAQEQAQLRSNTTDLNPVYSWTDMELAKAQTELPSLEAELAANEHDLSLYKREAISLEEGDITQHDLMRDVKASETNYLLYLSKREQARISDMLDARRVVNVVIAELPTVPQYPMISPLLLVIVCFILAGMISLGTVFTADYLDPSFRTPDEVTETLHIPVFASVPISEPVFQNGSRNGNSNGNGTRTAIAAGSCPKNGR